MRVKDTQMISDFSWRMYNSRFFKYGNNKSIITKETSDHDQLLYQID